MKKPRISVILTSFNHADFIGKSIDSILNQTFSDFELLIVDDFSTDHSWEIILGYKDSRIKAVRHESNWGADGVIVDMVNNHASGEYCAIAHSDDVWNPKKLEKQVEFLDKHPEISACFTLVDVIDEQGNLAKKDSALYAGNFEQSNKNRFEWLNHFFYQSNCLCHPSVLIRKNDYKECDLDVRGLTALPDFCQWIRLCLKKEIWILQEKLTYFRLRDNGQNTSGDTFANTINLYSEHYIVLKEFLKLNRAEDFIAVFPQAQKYFIGNEMVIEFAYAKILLEENNHHAYHLYGIYLLNIIFENSELREEIKKLYHYTVKDLKADRSKYDIFCAIERSNIMNSTIFFDFGQGFNEKDRIVSKNVYINKNKYFTVAFNIEDIAKNKNIKSIRFDPDEDIFRKYKIESVFIDDQQVNIKPLNSNLVKDGWNIFYTDDPNYLIENFCDNCKKITISGMAQENLQDIKYLINNLANQSNEMNVLINKITNSFWWQFIKPLRALIKTLKK